MKNRLRVTTPPAVLCCMGIGLLLSILVALRLYGNHDARIHQEFRHMVDRYAFSINKHVSENIAVLYSFRGLFEASEEVTQSEYRNFSKILLARYPSLKAVGWIKHVPANERESFETQAKENGLDNFQITERQEQGVMVRAGEREEYFPIVYIEPLEGNTEAVFFDLGSNPTRLMALHAARETGTAQATGRITLVQEKEEESAVLFYVPVYKETAANVDERHRIFQGVISGVFRFHNLMETAGTHLYVDPSVDVKLFDDDAAGERTLLHESDYDVSGLVSAYRYEKRLELVGGRQWVLTAAPGRAYLAGKRSVLPYGAFVLGLVITGWMSHYLARLAKEKGRVEHQVELRTNELQIQSAALAASNEDLGKEVALRERLQKLFADSTDHEQRRLGQELHDSLGQQVAVASMMARNLQGQPADAGESRSRSLNRLIESIDTAQAQVRAISKGLLPVEVNPEGFKDALAELVQSVRGLEAYDVKLEYGEGLVVEDNTVATQLYRIAQEALRNALEHGEVSRITIGFQRDEQGLVLSIGDDGKGFERAPVHATGSGLTIMHQRAERIGGKLTIESAEGQGTLVICRLADTSLGTG